MDPAELEWAKLKDFVQGAADATTGYTFDWCADEPAYLQLGYVAATFRYPAEGEYPVLFERKPRGPGFFPGASPLPPEQWELKPRLIDGGVVWSVRPPGPRGDFPSDRLAQRIVDRLVRCHQEYTSASQPK
jgi:hypothetical protein